MIWRPGSTPKGRRSTLKRCTDSLTAAYWSMTLLWRCIKHLWIGLFRNAADVSEYAIRADPSAGNEATEDGVEHPLPRSEHGGSLAEEKAAKPRPLREAWF